MVDSWQFCNPTSRMYSFFYWVHKTYSMRGGYNILIMQKWIPAFLFLQITVQLWLNCRHWWAKTFLFFFRFLQIPSISVNHFNELEKALTTMEITSAIRNRQVGKHGPDGFSANFSKRFSDQLLLRYCQYLRNLSPQRPYHRQCVKQSYFYWSKKAKINPRLTKWT